MTTTDLLQAIKGLAGKAKADCPNIMYLPIPIAMVPAITAALELAARVENPETVEADNDRLRKALKWALPLAERAMEDWRLARVKAGHSDIHGTYKNGITWAGIYQQEVDEIEDARAALKGPSNG